MPHIHPGRFTAHLGDRTDVVVFIIGMRINRLWEVWRWLPVFAAMPKMVNELCADPSLGLLARPSTYMSGRVFLLVQYWRSFEDLERFARAPQGSHLPAWRDFNRKIRDNGSVGIFHEGVVGFTHHPCQKRDHFVRILRVFQLLLGVRDHFTG